MKLYFCAILLFICFSSCSSADNVVQIYTEAINKANYASSQEELRNISIEVNEKLTAEGNKIGGNSELNAEDRNKVISARTNYENVLESANIRISGHKGQWE